MKYALYKDGEIVNTIVATPAFVDAYASAEGLSYMRIEEPRIEEEPPTELDQLRADIDYIAMETGVAL